MQRITKTQIAAIALAFVALTLSLADWLFACHLARYGLTAACDTALTQPVKSFFTMIWHDSSQDSSAISTADTTGISTADTAGISTADTTGIPTADTKGIPTADTTGISTADTTGISTADTTGILTADTAFYPSADTKGIPTADTTGISTADTAFYPSADTTGIPTADTTGISTADTTGIPTADEALIPTSDEACVHPSDTAGALPFCQAVLRRLCYPFLHAHPLHALINVWVLLQVVFRTRLGGKHLFWAFLVAWSCPAVVATFPHPSSPAVVGLSGVVYALLGLWMPYVARRRRYNAVVLLWLVAGALTGTVAAPLHLYCYLAGVLLSLKKSG